MYINCTDTLWQQTGAHTPWLWIHCSYGYTLARIHSGYGYTVAMVLAANTHTHCDMLSLEWLKVKGLPPPTQSKQITDLVAVLVSIARQG